MNIQSLLKKISIITFGNVFSKILWFFLFIFAARTLGPDDFGLFTLYQAICINLLIVIDYGFDYYFIKTVSGNIELSRKELENIERIRIAIFVIILILIIPILVLNNYTYYNIFLFLLILLFLVINVFNITYKNYFSANLKFNSYSMWTAVEKLLVSVAGITILLISSSLANFLIVITISSFVVLIVIRFVINNYEKRRLIKNVDWSLVKKAFPFMLMNLFVIGYFRIDILILNIYNVKSEQIGIYGAHHRLVESYMLFPSIITTVLFPYLSINQNKIYDVKINTSLIQYLLFSSTIIICSILTIYAKNISDLLWGISYSNGIENLGFIIWAVLPLAFNFLLGYYLIAAGKERENIKILIMAFLFNVTINVTLIPYLGIRGATLSLILTELIIVLLYAIKYDNYYNDRFVKRIYLDMISIVFVMCMAWYMYQKNNIGLDVYILILSVVNLYIIVKLYFQIMIYFRKLKK